MENRLTHREGIGVGLGHMPTLRLALARQGVGGNGQCPTWECGGTRKSTRSTYGYAAGTSGMPPALQLVTAISLWGPPPSLPPSWQLVAGASQDQDAQVTHGLSYRDRVEWESTMPHIWYCADQRMYLCRVFFHAAAPILDNMQKELKWAT